MSEETRDNLRFLKNRILWYIWQLLPFEYHSVYSSDGDYYHTVWRMWLGRCFWIRENIIPVNNAANKVVDDLYGLFGLDGDVDLVKYIAERVA